MYMEASPFIYSPLNPLHEQTITSH